MEKNVGNSDPAAYQVDEVIQYFYDANDRLLTEALDSDNDSVTDETTVYQYGVANDRTEQTNKTVWQGDDTDPGTGTKLSETTYIYDVRGRLESVMTDSNGNNSTSQYVHDDAGIRVSQTVDGVTTNYIIDANNPTGYAQVLEEGVDTDGNGRLGSAEVATTYTLGHDFIAQQSPGVRSGATLYFLYDGHGSTRALIDPNNPQLLAERYAYDAYGKMLPGMNLQADAATALTRFLYSGEQTDPTGLQYLRARYYDPAIGRFNRLDPFAGNIHDPLSLHKYLYAQGDPVDCTDPTGRETLGSLSASLGGISSLTANLSARVVIFAINHARILSAAGFVLDLALPQDIQDAMVGSGIPPFQLAGSASKATKGTLRALVASKSPAFTRFMQKYSASALGLLSQLTGEFFEETLSRFMPGAARQVAVGVGKHTVDFVWKGWVIEVKSGKSIDKKQLSAIAEYARVEGKTLVYYFLREPPKSVVKQIQDAGGSVISIY